MDEVINRLGQDALEYFKPQTHLLKGLARHEIPAFASKMKVDLMVMGTLSHTGISGFFMGNTAETILNLTNYSEFGLLVVAISVSSNWLDSEWMMVITIALSVSFIAASPLNSKDDKIYSSQRNFWRKFQLKERLADDQLLDTFGATIAIFGMGSVGSGAYDKLRELHGETAVFNIYTEAGSGFAHHVETQFQV